MRLRGWCSITMGLAGAVCLADAGCGGAGTPLALRKVVLYQNGVGYFERRGELRGDHYSLQLRRHEVGDVLKSMVIVSSCVILKVIVLFGCCTFATTFGRTRTPSFSSNSK